ncbi:MAK10-like protein, partial [Tanacetum coccineum]
MVDKRVWELGLMKWLDQGCGGSLVVNVGNIMYNKYKEEFKRFHGERWGHGRHFFHFNHSGGIIGMFVLEVFKECCHDPSIWKCLIVVVQTTQPSSYEVSKVEWSFSFDAIKHVANNDEKAFLSFNLFKHVLQENICPITCNNICDFVVFSGVMSGASTLVVITVVIYGACLTIIGSMTTGFVTSSFYTASPVGRLLCFVWLKYKVDHLPLILKPQVCHPLYALFCLGYKFEASNWLERLPAGSITTWEELTTRFLAQFFPLGRTAKLRNDILMFQQHQGESISEAWTRFKDLLQKVPHNGIDLWLQVQIFYDRVTPATRQTIDQSADDVLSISDRRLIELENKVQRLMEAHLALMQPTQVNKITSS